MAVANQTPYKEYIGNGTTKIFPLEFDCDDADHLIVKVNDIEVPALNNWSLNTNTGSVVFAIAPISQSKIILQRDTPLERNIDYQTYNNSFRPQPVNKDFDRIWLKLQELGYRDQVIWLALVKEVADRVNGDKKLQDQINTIDQQVQENTSDIAQLVDDLSQEIADRITNDKILKDMFLAIVDTAINEGTVNALAITHVDSLDELNAIKNVWEGRTVSVTGIGNYKYNATTQAWERDFITDRQVITVNTIAELLSLENIWDGRTVTVKSYLAGGDKRGGGSFIFTESTTQAVDDIFCYQVAGGYWSRKDQEKINIFQAGIDVSVDCTSQINTVFTKLKAKSIALDKVIEIDCFSETLITSGQIEVDVSHVFLKNTTFHFSETATVTSPTAILRMNGTVVENVLTPKSSTFFDNLVIKGPAFRTTKLVYGLLLNPEVNLNLPTFDNIRILNCNGGIVFGSNVYIASFNNCHIHRNNVALIDSVSSGFETTTSNAGENISFHHSVISENNQTMIMNKYNGGLCNFKFYDFSNDYNGGNQNSPSTYEQFVLDGGQFDFFAPHFESGNENDAQRDHYFSCGDETKVNLFGGWVMFANHYNDIPYFFYSRASEDRGKQAVFNMYHTMCYAPSVKYWANRDLGDFRPNISISDYTTSGRWQKKNTMMLNGNMSNKTVLIDNWFVEMNQVLYDNGIRQSNKQITTQVSVSMSEKGVLIVRPNAAQADATRGGKVYLLVPRPRSRYNPTLKFKIKSDNNTDLSATPIYVTCAPVQWSGFVSDFKIPENMQSPEEIEVSIISSLSTNEVEYSPVAYAAQKDSFGNCNYILVTFNLASNPSVLSFYVTDIELSQPN